jgi:hypothetical protein
LRFCAGGHGQLSGGNGHRGRTEEASSIWVDVIHGAAPISSWPPGGPMAGLGKNGIGSKKSFFPFIADALRFDRLFRAWTGGALR